MREKQKRYFRYVSDLTQQMNASPTVSHLSSPSNNKLNNVTGNNAGNNAQTAATNNSSNTNGVANGNIAVICSVINGQDQEVVNRTAFLALSNQQQQQQQQPPPPTNGINLLQERGINRQMQERVVLGDRLMDEIISQEQVRNTMHPPPLVISNHIQLNNPHERSAVEKNLNGGNGGVGGPAGVLSSSNTV